MKYSLRHLLEAAAIGLLFRFLKLLPLSRAAAFGGFVARNILFYTPFSRRAYRNFERVMPELDRQQQRRIVREMWDNLGRLAGEVAHLQEFRFGEEGDGVIKLVHGEYLQQMLEKHQAVILVSAHIGNWEVASHVVDLLGVSAKAVYRPANNPISDRWITNFRGGPETVIAKGNDAARDIIRCLKNGISVSMLVDQKLNTGIPVPFFGEDAMTSNAAAQIARRFDIPILPVNCVRVKGSHFRVELYPPLRVATGGERERDVYDATLKLNQYLESWIRAHPAQWLWLHNRWPKA